MEQAQPSSGPERAAVLWLVSPSQVVNLWPLIEPGVSKVVNRVGCRMTVAHHLQRILDHEAQLFVLLQGDGTETPPTYLGALITRILNCPNGDRILEVSLAAGEHALPHLVETMAGLEHFARAESCRAIEFVGRPGWGKVLEGFREVGRLYAKEL